MSKNSSPIGGFYPTSSNTSSNSSGTSSGTATQSPDPAAAYTYLMGLQNALGIAATPFQPYEGQMVAGFTPSQIAAQTGFQNAVGMSTPYYTASQDLYNQGLNYQTNSMLPTASNYYWQGTESAYNPMTPLSQQYFSQAIGAASPSNYNVEPYMNPYQQNVVDATMRQLEQTQKQALGQNTQQSVLRGSYGGSGQFLGRAEVARQQALSNAQTLAQLNANNYLNAQNQYNEQQKNQMQAYQAAGQQLGNLGYQNASLKTQALQNAAQGLGALGNSQQAQAIGNIQGLASGMAGLGNQSQQSYLQALAALQQSGAQQQQLQQNQLANAYQQFLQAKAYPYQQASYLSGLASGLGPLLGATTTQNSAQNSTGTGAQIGMQPYQNQSGGGGLFGGLTSLFGLGMKAFGFKDGGRVSDRKHYAAGGSAEDDSEEMDFGSELGQSRPYSSNGAPQAAGLGALIGQQPYASRGRNYATDALKLSKVIPSAKQVAQERLLGAISDAIRGTPDPNKAQAEYARQQSLAPVSHEITSSFFGAQEPSRSGLGGLGESRRSSRRDEADDDTESSKKNSGGFGSLLSGVTDNLSSLLNTEDGNLFASGGRVYRAEGGGAAAPQGLSPQDAKDYVTNLYSTQLGRQGDQAGMDYWTNRLQQGLDTKDQVSNSFAGSPEYNKNYVSNLYKTQLAREGDPAGIDYWANQIQQGLNTKDQVSKSFATGPEYSNQNYVSSLYKTQLGRQGDPAGIDYWTNRLVQGLDTRDQVSRGFAGSPEYNKTPPSAAEFVKNLYQTQLGRQADQNSFNYLTDKLQSGELTKDDLYRHFAYSPESQAKISALYQNNVNRAPDPVGLAIASNTLRSGAPLSAIANAMPGAPEAMQVAANRQKVQDLYQDKLGREGDPEGISFWTDQLQKGKTPEAMSRYFGTSKEAKKDLANAYQQTFGEIASGDQLSPWVERLSENAQSLDTVANNMLTSPAGREYNRTHPGIQGSAERRSPKTIGDLMETQDSIAFNKKMNPTGRSGAGFEALMAQAYENAPGPQFSPVQQGLQGMPDQSYYTKPLPNYPLNMALVNYPTDVPVTTAEGTKTTMPSNYAGISDTAPDQSPNDFVNSLYTHYLNRPALPEKEISYWTDRIAAGTPKKDVEMEIAKNTYSKNNSFVKDLYKRMFGRAADSEGLDYWTSQMALGMPASDVQRYFGEVAQKSSPVVQGYFSNIADTRINPYTGLANLKYVAPYKSQPVPYTSAYKDGGRVGRARGGSLSSRERIELAAKAALQAGASPRQAAMMAAISVPESNGNPYAHNPNARTGDNSYGLWQVNMLGGMGPERRKQFGLSRNEELFDPLTNARAALKIANGPGGLNNWTTYKHGKHLPYYSAAVDVVNNLVKDPSAVMAKIEAPAPLSLPTRGGEPSGSSIMYSAPRSQGTGLAEGSNPAQEKKGLRLSELIEDIIQPSLMQDGGSEQPKLATATPAPIIQLAEPMPMGLPLGNLGEENRGRYLDTVIAMNQRARGGRLHFADGGTDDESRERFYREQLKGSAPQYDEAAGNEALDKYGNVALDTGLGIMALSGVGAPLAAGLSTLKNAYRLGRRFEKNGEPGFGGLIESKPQAPRGRQPSPGGEPIPMGINVPKKDMNRFESNTEGMRRGIPGDEIWNWSTLRNPKGSQPMDAMEQGRTGLNWNRWNVYEPNKAPAYYDKFGNVAPPKVKYDGQSQRPIPPLEANQNYYPGRIPGNDLRAGSAGRGPASGRGFFNGRPEFTSAELGQEVAPLGARGMSVPPSRLPATRSNLPTFARGAREEGPIYADYRDVTGNILGGPRGGNLVPSTGGGGNLVPPGGGGRPPRNFRTKTATTMMAPPGLPPGSPPNLPPFNPNITSDMATPKLTEYYKVNPGLSAQDTPGAKRPRPARKAAPKSVDNRRYWGDWRDTAGFNEDPIGNFLDNLTGDRKVARKPGTINSPMSPYAGDRFAHGGRAYRGEGGLLGGLGDALSTGISNLRSSKRSPISEGLITAGLGMMASPQHNPLRAIGEGGLLGIQAYNTASEQDREEQKKLEQQKIDADFATKTLDDLRKLQPNRSTKPVSVSASDNSDDSVDNLFPKISISPIIKRAGGSVRNGYAQGGQPQQDEGFDPFEAIGAVGDTIGSGLQSLGDTIGNALMPSAQAQESEPAQARAPRKSSRSPIADGLITAGLGMMASPAHNPLRAIGEGGLRGVQAYETSADAQRKEDKLEEERQQNETFAKSLTPKTSATQENPVVAQDRTSEDPTESARRQLDYLSSVIPKNATQEKILTRLINQKKYELSGNVGIIGYDSFGNPKRGFTSGLRAGQPLPGAPGQASGEIPKDLHGEEFLTRLENPEIANNVRAIAEGRSSFPKGPRGAALRNAVFQYDPDYNEKRFGVREGLSKTATNTLGGTVSAGNTALQHLQEASDALQALRKREWKPDWAPVNWIQQHTQGLLKGGLPELDAFNTAKERFAEEATKFYRGTSGSLADVQRTISLLNSAKTPDQLNAILAEETNLFAGKVNATKDIYGRPFKSKYVEYEGLDPLQEETKEAISTVQGRDPLHHVKKSSSNSSPKEKKESNEPRPTGRTGELNGRIVHQWSDGSIRDDQTGDILKAGSGE